MAKIKRIHPVTIEDISDVLPHDGKWGTRSISAIDRIIVHHSDGWPRSTPRQTAEVHIDERHWPGIAYHFEVPYQLLKNEDRMTTYQLNHLDAWSYHTGPEWNEHGIAILVRGGFHSRHAKDEQWTLTRPTEQQMITLDALVRYLMFELHINKLYGHFQAGKLACPGDYLEKWVLKFKI